MECADWSVEMRFEGEMGKCWWEGGDSTIEQSSVSEGGRRSIGWLKLFPKVRWVRADGKVKNQHKSSAHPLNSVSNKPCESRLAS